MKIIVVVSQSVSGVDRREFEESLIASLLMESDGVEVTVIPDIDHLEDDTTGLLCLEGIRGDMVFASWNEPAIAFRKLSEKAVYGRFGRTSQSPEQPELPQTVAAMLDKPQEELEPGVYDAMRRRIYCLDLNDFARMEDVRTEVERIANENTTQVVGLGDLTTGAEITHSSRAVDPPSADPGQPEEPESAVEPIAPKRVERTPVERPDTPVTRAREALTEEVEWDEADEALEQLVDRFDELDL